MSVGAAQVSIKPWTVSETTLCVRRPTFPRDAVRPAAGHTPRTLVANAGRSPGLRKCTDGRRTVGATGALL